ncbi:hypothetical protein [Lysobacter antibioticus]|uniref:hypothetical protein n=1 Tax=Lysobacter antibioticus TaxID=84531 RepID=UPI0011403189|nr:hypothetical protein [Lysobacter antibioticus]
MVTHTLKVVRICDSRAFTAGQLAVQCLTHISATWNVRLVADDGERAVVVFDTINSTGVIGLKAALEAAGLALVKQDRSDWMG